MPPGYWFIKQFDGYPSYQAYHIQLVTDEKCHLWLRWSLNPPQKHPRQRRLRGIEVKGDVYYCFTAYHDIEQNEAGDTLIHTFDCIDWPYCQTRWFYFHGTYAGDASPSTSCIFVHHYGIVLYQHYNTGETSAYRFSGITWVAQTFTVQVPHSITQVTLMLNRLGNPGQATLGVWLTDPDGHPTGGDLVSVTFNANDLIAYPGKEWKTLLLPSFSLSPAKYALVLRAPFGGPGIDIGWWGDATSPTYTLGNFESGFFSGTRWSAIMSRDAMFEEWGTPT